MRAEDESLAAAQPLLQGLAAESISQLLQGAYLQRFPAHVELIHQGDHADFLHVVIEGKVEVFSRYRDRETTVNIIEAGAAFITAAVFLDRIYLKSARSLTPARLLLLPASAVRAVFHTDPAFAHKIAEELAKGYRSLVKEVSNLKLRSSLERLANWLLQQADRSGPTASFTFPFDKKTLAAKLGVAPEVLSRNFAALAAYGVTVTGKSVVVTDMALLENFAKPSAVIDDPEVS